MCQSRARDQHVQITIEPAPVVLALPPPAENCGTVAARVARARAIKGERYAGETDAHGRPVRINAVADGKLLERVATPDEAGAALLTQAASQLRLSARGYHRVLKVARTLADLDASEGITRIHIAEALSYRRITLGG